MSSVLVAGDCAPSNANDIQTINPTIGTVRTLGSFRCRRGHTKKRSWRERALREPGEANSALEIVHLIDAHANRRAPFMLRRKRHFEPALQCSVHVVPELAPVVDACNVMPFAGRME